MTVRLSSALRTALITNYGLGSLMQDGYFRLYAGAPPASPDLAQQGTYLGYISRDGKTVGSTDSGLLLQAGADPGTLVLRENWTIKGVAAGVVGWWRWHKQGDSGTGASTTAMRIDGAAVDGFGAGLTPTLANGFTDTIASFTITLPPN